MTLLDPSSYFVQRDLAHQILSVALGMSISCTLGQFVAFSGNLELAQKTIHRGILHLGTLGHNVYRHVGKEENEAISRKGNRDTNRKN